MCMSQLNSNVEARVRESRSRHRSACRIRRDGGRRRDVPKRMPTRRPPKQRRSTPRAKRASAAAPSSRRCATDASFGSKAIPEAPSAAEACARRAFRASKRCTPLSQQIYPMKRVGERGTNSFGAHQLGSGYREIAQKLTQDFFKYGGESLVTSTGGGGNPHFSSPCRFTQALGSPNIFEPGCARCFLPRMATFSLMYGGSKSGHHVDGRFQITAAVRRCTSRRTILSRRWSCGAPAPATTRPAVRGRAIADCARTRAGAQHGSGGPSASRPMRLWPTCGCPFVPEPTWRL